MPTQSESLICPDKVMDVRDMPCAIKHGLILRTFIELPADDYFVLRNGHDPLPLRYQFEAEFPGTFTWEYLRHMPEDISVKITKLKALPARAEVCAHGCGD